MADTSKTQGAPSLIDSARIEWKLGKYGVSVGAALRDPEPWVRAQDYRRATAARMVPIDRKDLRGRLPAGEYHLSRKVDGEFTVLVWRDGAAGTVNPGGTVRIGLPFLEEAAERLRGAGVRSALIAGELYFRRPDGGRERVHDVSRAARQPGSQEDLESLCFVAFDIIDIDGQPAAGAADPGRARARDRDAGRGPGDPGAQGRRPGRVLGP